MADKEYIERGALIAEYDRFHVGAPGGARKLMVEAPAADVVEVVRCKDCKKHGHKDCIVNRKMACGDHETTTKANDFCSYGERKAGNEKGAVNGSEEVPGENQEN